MRLPFMFALVGALLLLLASKAGAGTERVTTQRTIEVDAILKSGNKFTHRKVKAHPFTDGRIVVCQEFKDKVEALCMVLIDDGDVVIVPVRMLEEKV